MKAVASAESKAVHAVTSAVAARSVWNAAVTVADAAKKTVSVVGSAAKAMTTHVVSAVKTVTKATVTALKATVVADVFQAVPLSGVDPSGAGG